MTTKTCKTCKAEKSTADFEPRRLACRDCRSKERADRKAVLAEATRPAETPVELLVVAQREPWVAPSEPHALLVDPLAPIKADFRKFLWLVWKHINLPPPTALQLDIAYWLQHGPNKICIEAFRGVGKSFITSAYILWELLRDPQKKILVVSASKVRADNFTTFTMDLIDQMPVLAHLKARDGQRSSKVMFDVGPALPDQSPSVMSLGITSQLAGTRADIIIADDIEVMNNSATSDMREKLLERTKEFSAILKPLDSSKTIYLGTPQTEDSIYNKLPETFTVRIWPSMVPTTIEGEKYGTKLAPYVRRMMVGQAPGEATDPVRFSMADLIDRQSEYGKAGFALQFMLNTQLSDLERFPLKVRDLIIASCDLLTAPMQLNWLPDPDRVIKELTNLAMVGDKFYHPRSVHDTFAPYTGSVMSIDPSGRGKDETGYAVVKMLNATLFVPAAGGLAGGYEDSVLIALAEIAKANRVNTVIVESNFGDGMFTRLLTPVLNRIWPCLVEEVNHNTQKERRIIDTLEPVMARHKLVIDPKVIEDDYRTAQAYEADNKFTKSLIYQLTRITSDRGVLKHDDRLDALAIAVAYWTEQMSQDEVRGLETARQEALDKELEKFLNHALGTAPRTGSWGIRRH